MQRLSPCWPHAYRFVMCFALAGFAVAIACDGGDDPAAPTPTLTTPIATLPVATPTFPPGTEDDPRIRIVAPAPDATLDATFVVEVAVTGATLELGPASELVPGGANWHLLINGELQPQAHDTRVANVGPLTPGDYELTTGLYLNDMDQTPVAATQIKVTVE